MQRMNFEGGLESFLKKDGEKGGDIEYGYKELNEKFNRFHERNKGKFTGPLVDPKEQGKESNGNVNKENQLNKHSYFFDDKNLGNTSKNYCQNLKGKCLKLNRSVSDCVRNRMGFWSERNKDERCNNVAYFKNIGKQGKIYEKFRPLIVKDIGEKEMPTMLEIYKNFLINQNTRNHINHSLSKQIDPKSLVIIDKNLKIKCSKFDVDKIKTLKSIIDFKSSGYIGNINNYDIIEGNQENKRCSFEFERKNMYIYDPIVDRVRKVKPPNIKLNKWDKYSETFFVLDRNFHRKCGMINESIKRNAMNYVQLQNERRFNFYEKNGSFRKEKKGG